jgi:ureidoglycolate lyase
MLTRRSTTVDLIQHLTTDASASESAIVAIPLHHLENLAEQAQEVDA